MIESDLTQFANKRFGQNFLKSDFYIHKIIQAISNDDLPVIEIGPGLGDLTKELVRVRSVTAFEVDKRLCEHLQSTFNESIQSGRLDIKCGDVLERWGSGSLLDRPYQLVANLPYYIATNIILRALKDPNCQSILVMVQKEVAERFSAKAGTREFSALSILAQKVGKATLCFEVEAEAFIPPPKVTSAVLLIEKDYTEDDENFEAFLKVAFKQPRKKLFKNLSVFFDKDNVANLFNKLDLDPNIRPHEAEISIYHRIYNELKDILDGQEQKQRAKLKTKQSK